MTPQSAKASYRRALLKAGTEVSLRRGPANGAPSATFKARLVGYKPEELTGDVQQGDTKVIFLADDIGGYPLPLLSRGQDAIWFGQRKMTVQAVDDMTRRVEGVLIAYELRVRG